MKRLLYACALLAVLAGCSKDDAETSPQRGETGLLRMNISATRTDATDDYDPLERLTVRLYNADGALLRKYASREDLPSEFELLAGEYRVTVEAGEQVAASHTKRFYKGENSFPITAGGMTTAEVKCELQNTVVEVSFDESIAANFGSDFYALAAIGDTADAPQEIAGNALRFTADGKGYFTLPEGAETLSWSFTGMHPERGEIVKRGSQPLRTDGRYRYRLTFRFSEDLPGYVEGVTVTVDPSTDDYDDTIVFSPDPTIETEGDFDPDTTQDYVPGITGDRTYLIATVAPISRAELSFDDETYLLIGTRSGAEGIRVEQTDDTHMTVTLTGDFFTGRTGGEHTVAISVTDTAGGSLTRRTPFRLPGLLPVETSDYDLWNNTVTLRALVFGSEAPQVGFGLRTPGGEWQEAAGVPAGDNIYTATIGAEWQTSVNDAGLTVHTPVAGTGVFAQKEYEYRMTLDGTAYEGSFSTPCDQRIPYGDMEDGNLSCFTSSNKSTAFWGSGNNNFAKTLCSQVAKGGSHCAQLQSAAAGALGINMLAAGNLFTGTFDKPSMQGTVGFGKDYDWKARPTALRLRFHATIGSVDYTKWADDSGSDPIAKGQPDKGRIYVAIVDWDSPRNVSSGTSAPSGMWDPATASSLPEGAIIGYGSLWVTESTAGDDLVELTLPISYYDTAAKPSKPYKIVISCSANAYGDYMNGCSSNRMYVDDFEWVY